MDSLDDLRTKIIPPSIAFTGIVLMWASTFNFMEIEYVNLDFLSPLVFISGIGMQVHWLYNKGYFR